MDDISLSSFKVITFDVVGTLIDFESGIIDSIRKISGRDPNSLSNDSILESYKAGRAIHSGRSSQVLRNVYEHMAADIDLPNGGYESGEFQQSLFGWRPFADSIDALKCLRRRFRLVALTNADRVAFSGFERSLDYPFHDSVTVDEAECSKPSPQFFDYNRGRQSVHGFGRSEILHVAQSQQEDISVTKRLGYTNVWIQRRFGKAGFGASPSVAELTTPDYHFTDLASLVRAIEEGK